MSQNGNKLNKEVSLLNIKSNIIIKQIAKNLEEIKFLQIIRYNKKIQNRVNKTLNYYKDLSTIRIEIIPVKNEYGTFINCEDYNNYHIYFNDNEKEIKRNSIEAFEKVSKINVIIDYKIKSLKELFMGCECIEKINFTNFRRKDITDMSYIFYGCSSIKQIVLNNFLTDNVTNMSYMFYGCSLLENLDLSKFKTENVTNMSHMFHECEKLKELNISNFKTINVIDMSFMFKSCRLLRLLNISNFNTCKVTNMSFMFEKCELLEELFAPDFNTDNVAYKIGMFNECSLKIRQN